MSRASFFAFISIISVMAFCPVFADEPQFLTRSNSWEKDPYGCELEGMHFQVFTG